MPSNASNLRVAATVLLVMFLVLAVCFIQAVLMGIVLRQGVFESGGSPGFMLFDLVSRFILIVMAARIGSLLAKGRAKAVAYASATLTLIFTVFLMSVAATQGSQYNYASLIIVVLGTFLGAMWPQFFRQASFDETVRQELI